MAGSGKKILIYGGKGALGSTCVSHFKTKGWWVGSVDLAPNEQADANVLVEMSDSWTKQGDQVCNKVADLLGEARLDAVVCVAGGWAGGGASSKDFLKNCDLMWKQSVWTSTIAASIAAKHLNDGGVVALTGAQPALQATPGMIGYGLAKAAVHQLVASLSQPKGGLPDDAFISAILPITLNTPMNRKFMPNADQSCWTPLETVAELFYNWCSGVKRPANGSLVQLVTKDNSTEFVTA